MKTKHKYTIQFSNDRLEPVLCTVEPRGGRREVMVTKQRKKTDFAIVLDNLNTHFEKSFIETFGKKKSDKIMNRVQFHYTPKHASWLNMAEIEIGIFSRQSIKGRIPTEQTLADYARIWQKERNRQRAMINWKFTVKDARTKFNYTKGSKLT